MDIRAIGLGLAFALMWSSAFTSAHIIVAQAPPLLMLALRFVISGAMAVGIALALGQRVRLNRAQWRATIVFGICQNALYLGLFFLAMQRIDASLAAIMASTMPLMVAVAAWLFLRDPPPPLGILGLVAGFAGVALIMSDRLSGGADLIGLGYGVAGVRALSLATLSVRGASSGGNLMMIVGLQMLIGAAVLLVAGLALERWEVTWTWELGIAFGYTVLVPGLLATWVWFVLVDRIGAIKGATFHFLNPFFGVAIAAVVLGERLGLRDVIGVAIIAAGILAVQLSRARN